jgi:rod shape determining protein RodA
MSQGALRVTRLGWGLALPVMFLTAMGLTTIHTTERPSATVRLDAGSTEGGMAGAGAGWAERLVTFVGPRTLRQAAYLLGGLVLMTLAMVPSYQKLGRLAFPFYGVVMVALVLLAADAYIDLPLIPVERNTRRWIKIGGLGVQPSEFMKLALIVALARYLRFRTSYRTPLGLIPPFLMTLLPMVLILKQPDLGTLLMLLPVLFAMLFVAGARLRHLILIVVLGGATLPVFYRFGMSDYQRKRIDVVFRQGSADQRWHMNEGYQLRQSKIALGSGGLTGEGYRQGAFVRRELLPEDHNDFIFAMIGNQWGLIGCALVIGAYALIVLFGLEVAMLTNDPFGRLLPVGVVVMIVVQALLNISMTVGLAPITGMPLPFVSAGGSSLWTNFLALGLLLNVAQRRPMLIAHTPFEHQE